MQHEELTGIVDHIIFHNEENGFTVFVVQTAKTHKTTIKGHTVGLQAGQQVIMQGSWIVHPKFGKQFEATQCTISLPTSLVGIKKYLSSGMIKGIGPVYAEKMIQKFGTEVLEIIDQYPYRLREVSGIGEKRIDRIITAWKDQKEISHIMVFLQGKNISPAYATKIYKKYGIRAIAVLQENPYRLADDIWGIGFKIADQIAKSMGFAHDSLKRISSGILYTLSLTTNNGHIYADLAKLKIDIKTLLELEDTQDIAHKIKLSLHDLYESKRICLITHNDIHYLALTSHYHAEKGIALKISHLLKEKSRFQFDIQAIYQQLRTTPTALSLTEDQQRGILTCLQHKVTVITGGPGTGKTTLIKELLTILDAHKIRYKLAAPTGRAAKRITESTRRPAATLHRLLEFDAHSMSFQHNEQNALPLDFLIVDEASMIDVFLAYALLKAMPYYAHLILIGDVDQLPSVGPGNVLHDIIASNIVPTISLTTIFRQAQNSMIIVNAHRINHGEFPATSLPDTVRDFFFIKEENPEMLPQHLHKIYGSFLPKRTIKQSNSVVLTPMNRGSAGTIVINDILQNFLNPAASTKKEIHRTGTIFRIGDCVMQIKNNYDKIVFNGDMGIIETIDLIDQIIAVRFIDRTVEYENTELDELVLAYAISIHKSQGSEFDAVIVPIFTQHFTLLQRNLIYTAITRAKKLCIFIGQVKAIAIAIKNKKGRTRITFLSHFLTSDLQCR
jgi:exodeoxyribonuclease V alpha subunit